MNRSIVPAIACFLVFGGMAAAQLVEIEPNENKAQSLANGPFLLSAAGPNTYVTGTTTGTSTTLAGAASADTFLIKTEPLPLGIYQHSMTITTAGTAGHTGTLRGLTQTAGVINAGTDATAQTSVTSTLPARMNRWYGFGKSEQIHYRVAGTSTTSMPYVSTLTTTQVTPAVLGPFQGGLSGQVTITTVGQGHSTDTEIWVYDSNLNAIPGFGNDDEPAPSTVLQSRLTRNFAPGTYYMAVSAVTFANNQPAPADDRFQTGTCLDFPDVATHGSSLPTTVTTAPIPLNFNVIDACGWHQVSVNKPGSFSIAWYQFTVLGQLPVVAGPWETNSPECDMNLDSLQNTNQGPIDLVKCLSTYTRVNFNSTLVGNGYDIGITTTPGVPVAPCGTGIPTPGGQVINLSPIGLAYAFGLSFPPFPGNYHIPFHHTSLFTNISGQMVILDPGHADGVQLSALNQLHSVAPGTLAAPLPGPTADDSSVTVDTGGSLAFFGRCFTRLFVISNGRVMFTAADTDFSPTVAEALLDNPFVGPWTDMNPGIVGSGQISISSPAAGIIRADWNGVRYFNSTLATQTATFGIQLDGNNGVVTIDGLGGITNPSPLLRDMFFGISKGNLGATNGGATTFGVGGPNDPAGPHDMIYAFGQAGTLTPGMNSITFTPTILTGGIDSYSWTGN